MNTYRIIGVVLLVLGVALLFLGYQSSQGIDDQISETLTGNYTQSTIWYLLLGAVSTAAGGAALLLGRR